MRNEIKMKTAAHVETINAFALLRTSFRFNKILESVFGFLSSQTNIRLLLFFFISEETFFFISIRM